MSGAYLRSGRPMSVCSRVRRLGYTYFQWQNSLPVRKSKIYSTIQPTGKRQGINT